MNTSLNRSLAKVLGRALLLTATLALPVESFGAPSPNPRAAAMDKDDNKRNRQQQRNANKANRQDNRRQVQAQRQENRKQVQVQRQQNRPQVKQQAQRQEARRQVTQYKSQKKAEQKAVQQQAQWQRQEARRQAQLQAQQRAQLQRQQAQLRAQQQQAQWQRQQNHNRQLQFQRQAEWRRQEEARRLAQQRRNNGYHYPGDRYARDRRAYNNQYDRYHQSGERFHIDGFVVEESDGYCSLLRDHQGHVFALVGNIGDIVQGDHLRLQGRVVGGEACDWRGTAFEVIQVKTLWDNNRHESASYDYQRDRYSFEEFLDNRY